MERGKIDTPTTHRYTYHTDTPTTHRYMTYHTQIHLPHIETPTTHRNTYHTYTDHTQIHLPRGPTYNPTVRQSDGPIFRQSDKCFISLKVNTITCVIWGQKPNRLLTKERSRTSETRYQRRTNNWQGHTRTQKNTYMNNTDSMKTWIQS